MAPLIVLSTAFLVLALLGALGVGAFRSWVIDLRYALVPMFLLTASAHWGTRRADLVRMVPPRFRRPGLMVTLTGVAEVAGAVGLLIPALAPVAAAALALLLVAVFPANIQAARQRLSIARRPATPLVPRMLIQLLFIAALLVAGFAD